LAAIRTRPYNAYQIPLTGSSNFGSEINQYSSDRALVIQCSSRLTFGFLQLPAGYVSGAPLSNTTTLSSKTLASLNLATMLCTSEFGVEAIREARRGAARRQWSISTSPITRPTVELPSFHILWWRRELRNDRMTNHSVWTRGERSSADQ